jgi:hypothetical protein
VIIKSQSDAALERIRRMVDLYGNYMVTEGSLFGAIADAVPTVPVAEIVRLLPDEFMTRFREWVAALPEVDDRSVVYWPISDVATVAFKNWLSDNPMQS